MKKMIDEAANLGRAHIRLFLDGTEYISNDENTLDFLFPTLEVIIFNLAISADTHDIYDVFISLKLNKKYCPLNPYFYCYVCGKVFVLNVYFQMYVIVIIIKKKMIIYNLDKN